MGHRLFANIVRIQYRIIPFGNFTLFSLVSALRFYRWVIFPARITYVNVQIPVKILSTLLVLSSVFPFPRIKEKNKNETKTAITTATSIEDIEHLRTHFKDFKFTDPRWRSKEQYIIYITFSRPFCQYNEYNIFFFTLVFFSFRVWRFGQVGGSCSL